LVISGYGLPQNTVAALDSKKQKTEEGENDYILVKLSTNGDELWRKIIGSSGQDQLTKTIETRDGSYLLAGTSDGKSSRDKQSNSQAQDFWIVKLQDPSKPLVQKATIEAIPNPTNQFTNIIAGFSYETATVSVYDLLGKQLYTKNITDRTIPIDLGVLPNGVYIVEVDSKKEKASVKVMKN
jgi:hypothetical protein